MGRTRKSSYNANASSLSRSRREENPIRGIALARPQYFQEARHGLFQSAPPVLVDDHPDLAITVMRDQGLRHIHHIHGNEFQRMFDNATDLSRLPVDLEGNIIEMTMHALSVGEVVGRQGASASSRPVYRLGPEHHPALRHDIHIAITVGANGYVVGANPIRRARELKKVLAHREM